MRKRIIDLSGQRFEKLTAVKVDPKVYRDGNARWHCLCDCGNTVVVVAYHLRSGNTKSCGCLVTTTKTHGLTDTPEYDAWKNIKQRCNNSKDRDYKNYGGRGITVCDEWNESFEAFYLDMGSRPTPEHSLDRKENNKGYFKENCRWATRIEQANNTRTNVFYQYNGVARTLAGWCRELNLDYQTVYARMKQRGWSFEEAITTTVK